MKVSFFGKEFLSKGLNVSDNQLIVGIDEMTIARNILVSNSVTRKKRYGLDEYYTGVGTPSPYPAVGQPIRGAIQYWRAPLSGSPFVEDIILHSENKVWLVPNRLSAATDITGALALSSTATPRYRVFEGDIFFCSSDPSDGYNKFDGVTPAATCVTATAPADGPGTMLGTWQGRMVMSGNADFPFRVYISGPLDAEEWTSLGGATSLDLTYDGDPEGATCILGELQGRLYVATRRSVYEISASDPNDVATYFVRRITCGVGCVGAGAFCATANDILFWSDRGFHSLMKTVTSDQVEITFLSRDIQKLFTEQTAPELLSRISVVWDETLNCAITSVASAGQLLNDTLLVFNITFQSWTIWTDTEPRSIFPLLINNRPYVGVGTEGGQLAIFDPSVTEDFGEGIAAQMRTGKFFPGNDITSEKRFKTISILVTADQISTITANVLIDQAEETVTLTHTINIGQESDLLGSSFVLGQSRLGLGRTVPFTFSIDAVGYNMQLELVATGDETFEYMGCTVDVEEANDRIS